MFSRKRHNRLLKYAGICSIGLFLSLGILLISIPLPEEQLKYPQASTVVMDRNGKVLRVFSEGDSLLFRIPLSEINHNLVRATISTEDKRFYQHCGLDPLAVFRATFSNIRQGRIVSGASTITMQLVRLLEPRPRTLRSKLIETFRALQLELKFSKNEILEYYLNLAPYGSNIKGVEVASWRYFGKHAKDLTLSESALLSGLPQAPSRLRPDRNPEAARQRRDFVLRRMHKLGFIGYDDLINAINEPVHKSYYTLPFEAPHFTRMVKQNVESGKRIVTTLDYKIQGIAERLLVEVVERLSHEGVTNGAVVIIDNKASSIRALVGSCSFFSEIDSGQVNGALARRSPGSALKPFIYILAMEKGICSPTDRLADVSFGYKGYSPENYTGDFSGPVSIKEALCDSLNIPALRLLVKVRTDNLFNCLKAAGITTLSQGPEHYGLSLALGSGEVSLVELANVYACLARLGQYQVLRMIKDEPAREARKVFSKSAAFLVADMLSHVAENELPFLPSPNPSRPLVALKTGTSYGNKDAWAIGFNPEYTVAVWLGNFSGSPSPALIGISTAAPVVWRIFKELYVSREAPWYEIPEDVGRREVCALSGMPAGLHCPDREKGFYIKGVSPYQKCSVHQMFMVDRATGYRLCSHCREGRDYSLECFEVWPPDINTWLRSRGMVSKELPPHLPECVYQEKHRDLKITSPVAGQEYVLVSHNEKLLLGAEVPAGTSQLYWFINGDLYKTTRPVEKIFWPMRPGKFRIACIDETGQSSSVSIIVYQN